MQDVQVIISGFGSFNGVPNNPTQRIVSWLQQQYGVAAAPAPWAEASAAASAVSPPPRTLRHGRIHSCTILKVSARAVNTYLVQQLEDLKQRSLAACSAGASRDGACCGQPSVVLLLHFGADIHVSFAL